MIVRFNVNNYVRVRLTETGRRVHREGHEELMRSFPKAHEDIRRYRPPEEDSDGWSRWQLWALMAEFGPHTSLGSDPCFETEIELEAGR